MRRPTLFLSPRSHSADLLASELVLAICDQFPKSEVVGVLGKYTAKTRAQSLVSLDDFMDGIRALGVEEGIKPLTQMLEDALPQLAVFFGYSKVHHELAGFFKDHEVPVILYEVTPGQALQGVDANEAHDRIKIALSIHKSGSAFLRAGKIPFQYIGTPFHDRVSKVIVKNSDFDFLNDKPLVTLYPGGYGDTLDRMLPRFGAFADNIIKSYDCQIVVSLREEAEFQNLVQKMKSNLPSDTQVKFVLGMHLELLSLSRLAISGAGAITIEAAISGVPTIAIYDKNDAPDEAGYYSLVNQSLGQKLFPEFAGDTPLPNLQKTISALLKDGPEREDLLKKLDDVQSEFIGSATDNAADFIIQEAGLRVKRPRSPTVPPA